MWTIIKFHTKNLSILKNDILNKLGKDVKFYIPKIQLQKFKKNKIYLKESFLLGDYLLCYHKNFSNKNVINSLKYCKGLKYFLTEYLNSQEEIENFVVNCKQNEDKKGYLQQSFFQFKNKEKFEFISGPFSNLIFKIVKENKFSFKALMGKFSVTVSKKDYLFRPV
tara:strand:+ start:369 stop:866 length:498 start_codon:yes stop_codon:yes gene_type:complete